MAAEDRSIRRRLAASWPGHILVNDPEVDTIFAGYHEVLENHYETLVDRTAFVGLFSDQRRWDVIALPGAIHLFVVDFKYNVLFSTVKALILSDDVDPSMREQALWALAGLTAYVAGDYRRSIACLGVAYGLAEPTPDVMQDGPSTSDNEQAYDRLQAIRDLANQNHDEAWLFLILHEAAHVIVDGAHPASAYGRRFADSVLEGMLDADLRQIADLRAALDKQDYIWRGSATTAEAMEQEIVALEEFVAALRAPEQLKREIACDYHALVATLVNQIGFNPFEAGSRPLKFSTLTVAIGVLRFVVFGSTIMSQIVWLKGTMERLRDAAPVGSINRAMVEQRIRLNVMRTSARDALAKIRTRRFSKAARAKKTADAFLRSLMKEDLDLLNERFAKPFVVLRDRLRDEDYVDNLFSKALSPAVDRFGNDMASETDLAGLASEMVATLPF